METLHVLAGENSVLARTRQAGRAGGSIDWIVPKNARVGDKTVFFFRSKEGFLGFGRIATLPRSTMFGRKAAYGAKVDAIRLFRSIIPLPDVAAQCPWWEWTKYPRHLTTVSGPKAIDLSTCLEEADRQIRSQPAKVINSQPLAALEGIVREVRVVTRGRSKRLRSEALSRAVSVCAVCNVDFGKVLNGLGVHVLQVHHTMQLSLSTRPRLSSVEELAVVCANCHALIHMNPGQVIEVGRLRQMLGIDAGGG